VRCSVGARLDHGLSYGPHLSRIAFMACVSTMELVAVMLSPLRAWVLVVLVYYMLYSSRAGRQLAISPHWIIFVMACGMSKADHYGIFVPTVSETIRSLFQSPRLCSAHDVSDHCLLPPPAAKFVGAAIRSALRFEPVRISCLFACFFG